MRRPGVSVIEVIIALGIAAVVIAAVGNLVAATHRLSSASIKNIQGTAYAKQWLEIISSQANQQFGPGSSCPARPGYTSCWTTPNNTAPFVTSTGTDPWTTTDTPAAGFTRTLTVATYNGDLNEKQVTVNVSWAGGHSQLSTLLTAWKNF